jgi:large subunit ribosomal protein L33
MANSKNIIVYLIPESETRDSHTYHYTTVKTKTLTQEHKKLKLRKYNPVKRVHEMFVEARLPKHTK